ncbi:MAG TPA: hypothetical protein EYP97_02090, partial [Acidimicrobiia bacterium]|nr:hypothetical protein [Acidimicrobiia bacterium]
MDALVIKSHRGNPSLGIELAGYAFTAFTLRAEVALQARTASTTEELGRIEATFPVGIEEVRDPSFHTSGLRVEVALRTARIGLEEGAERVAARPALRAEIALTLRAEVARLTEREGPLRLEEVALEATLLVELEDRTVPASATLRGSERISLRARTEGIATLGTEVARRTETSGTTVETTVARRTHHHGKEVVAYCAGVFTERLEAGELRLAPRAVGEVIHVATRTVGLVVGAETSSGCEVSIIAEALIAGGERVTKRIGSKRIGSKRIGAEAT